MCAIFWSKKTIFRSSSSTLSDCMSAREMGVTPHKQTRFCKPSPEQNKVTLMRCFCTLKTKISVGFLLFGWHALSAKDAKGHSQTGQKAHYRCKCIGVFIYWLIDFLTLHSQLLLFQCSCTAVPQCNIELCSIISAHKQHMHVLTHTTTALSLLWADVLCSNVKYSLCSVRYYVLYFFHCTQTMCPCTLILTHTLHLPSSSAASGNEANDGQTNPLPALRCCTLTKYKYKKAVVHIQKDTNRDTSPAFPILIIINDIYTMYIIH